MKFRSRAILVVKATRGHSPLWLALLLLSCLGACKRPGGGTSAGGGQVDLVARGRLVYQSNCTACHNSDPTKAGPLGPDLKGASLELITLRVLKGEYPAGYKPKRTTHTMAAIPQLEADVPAIHAYISSLK